jgi:HEAT repeat protein
MDQLLSSLAAPDLLERIHADCTLIATGKVAVEPLVALVNNLDSPNEARWRAAANLGDIGDPRAVAPLIAAIADQVWEVRASAIWALGMLEDKRAFDALSAIVESPIPDEQNSYVAARALFKIDPERAVKLLRQLINDSNHRVRSWARSALANLEFEG